MKNDKKETLLLLDFNNILYRGIHVNATLSYKGRFTGGLYGFINQLCSSINEVDPDRVIVCTDTPPYERANLFPEYKAGRKKEDRSEEEVEDFRRNKEECIEFLEIAGIPFLEKEGLEADDLFAHLTRMYNRVYRVVIASNDSDLYQLLDYITIYKGKKKGFYDRRKFFQEYHQMKRPKDWAMVAALAGSHNGVPKVRTGIGEVTAIRLLNLSQKKQELEDLWGEYGEVIERNQQLCLLPFPGSTLSGSKVRQALKAEKQLYHARDMIRFLAGRGIQYSPGVMQALEKERR